MARFELLTSRTPAGFLQEVAHHLVRPELQADWCVVVPRAHLMRDVAAALLAASGQRAWLGIRTLTTHQLIEHYTTHLTDKLALSPLQVRQVVHATIKELQRESGGEMFRGQVVDGRISEATLRSLTRLFAEIEPHQYEAEDLVQQLLKGPSSKVLSRRAREVTETYRRYKERLRAGGYVGPLGVPVRAADLAASVAPPFNVHRFLFLGLDGSGARDVGIRLAYALKENPHVDEVWLALVVPETAGKGNWSFYGNKLLVDDFTERTGRSPVALEGGGGLDALPADLAALARDPFAYGEPPVALTGAVRGVRVPDTQVELEWIAADAKRRILDEGVAPDEIAVIDRSMESRAEEFEQAFARLGVPVVSSRELPVADVPAVRALLTLFRLPAYGWRLEDLVALAESPYVPTGLNPTLLSRLGGTGTLPKGVTDWQQRISRHAESCRDEATVQADDALLVQAAQEANTLETGFAQLVSLVEQISAAERGNWQTPEEWVHALVDAVERVAIEDQIYATSTLIDREQRALLARNDLDGTNALLRAANDWLAGRHVAGLPADEQLSATAWCWELEAIARETRIRASTYPRTAVQLLTPRQAALRRWRVVYIAGLVDGIFPQHAEPDEYTLSEEERRAIMLPTAEQRAAKERLHFHLAVAAASETLILVAAAADERGKALVTSPFLTCLPLRLDGFAIEQLTARALVPADEQGILGSREIDLLAAERYRELARPTQDAATRRRIVEADPLLRLWLGEPRAERAIHAWGIEHARMQLDRLTITHGLGVDDRHEYVGLFAPNQVPAEIAAETATFSPAELAIYDRCHFRFYATRLLGLRTGPNDEDADDHDEAAAFGTLQHRVLERLYKGLARDGLLPPHSITDIETALVRLETETQRAVREFTASAHEQLWELDLEFVLDVLRGFVRRDLSGMLEAETTGDSLRIRTRPIAFELNVGGPERPIEVKHNGIRFRLHGRIDRVEEIVDERLPEAVQKWLIVRDYKSTRNPWGPSLKKMLAGDALQLPLYAYMGEKHLNRRVFGFGELRTSQASDPDLIAVRQVLPDGAGSIRLERGEIANPVRDCINAALDRAAALVAQMRRGDFAPQRGRRCYGCPLRDICRASLVANPGRGRQRASMPLAVSRTDFDNATMRAEAHRATTTSAAETA